MNRILVLSNYFYPTKGGVSRFATEICRHLTSSGHKVVVVTEFENKFDYSGLCSNFNSYKGFRSLPSLISGFLRNITCVFNVISNYQKGDVVLIITWRIFGPICWALKIPYVLVAHGSELTHKNAIKGIPFAERLKRNVFSKARVVLCNSRYTEKIVKEISMNVQTSVVGCGVNIDYWDSIVPVEPQFFKVIAGHKFVISVGVLTKRKGFDLLISVFAKSMYSKDDFLVIVGTGDESEYLLQCIEKYGLEKQIIIVSGITDSELAYLYLKADIFAMLNYNYQGDYEGFGIVFLEASYLGLPTIGGVDGGSVDAIVDQQTGFLADPLCEEERIISCLNSFYADNMLIKKMALAGRKNVKDNHTWNHVSERIYKSINNIPI